MRGRCEGRREGSSWDEARWCGEAGDGPSGPELARARVAAGRRPHSPAFFFSFSAISRLSLRSKPAARFASLQPPAQPVRSQ